MSENLQRMRLIGYWIMSLRDEDYFAPQEFVRPLSAEVRAAVADYLSDGDVYETYRGFSWCRFFCGRKMGCREFSDGHWVWPEDLVHYVSDHGITLPEEFLEHVGAKVPRIPASHWRRTAVDTDFWKRWCRQNARGDYARRIAEARLLADAEEAKWLAASVDVMEAQEGVSNERCLWQGCGNAALKGRALCARCSLRGIEDMRLKLEYGDLRRVLAGPAE